MARASNGFTFFPVQRSGAAAAAAGAPLKRYKRYAARLDAKSDCSRPTRRAAQTMDGRFRRQPSGELSAHLSEAQTKYTRCVTLDRRSA